jgi:hypothetical protein
MGVKPLAVAAVLSLALVSCGGSQRLSKSAYERKVRAIGMEMFKDYQEAFASGPGRIYNVPARKRAGEGAEAAVDRAAARLDALNPPSDAVADTRKAANGLRAWGKFQHAAALATPTEQPALGRAFSAHGARDLLPALADLQRKGYRLAPLTAGTFVRS